MTDIVVNPAGDFRSVEQVLIYTPSGAGAVAPSDLLDESAAPDTAAAAPSPASPGDSGGATRRAPGAAAPGAATP
jgi:hypothetical protein